MRTHGVTVRWREERKVWEVLWRDSSGRKRRAACASKSAAMEKASGMRTARTRPGADADAGDPAALAEWRLIRAELGTASVADLLAVWARHKGEVVGSAPGLTLGEAVERYLAMREAEGLGGDSFLQARSKLERLRAALGERALAGVGHDELRAWLAGTGFGGWSLVHHDKWARAFFARAVREGWVAVSPMGRLSPPAKPREEVRFLSVEEGRRLFGALRDDPISARLALEAFGGLRYSGAGRLEESEVLWEERALVVPAAKAKDGKRHFLQGMPDNLWAWLERWRHDRRAWEPLTKRRQQAGKSAAFARAGVENPGNALRHAFCSYLIARDKDAKLCSHLMQHRSPDMLYRHYRGAASEADGSAWFGITP